MGAQELPTQSIRYPDDLEIAEAALDGEEEAIRAVKEILDGPVLRRWLIKRGASETEADDLLATLLVDCFGGEKVRGGLHRILGKFNGACRLSSFLRRVALNRLISLKRKKDPTVALDRTPGDGEERAPIDTLEAPISGESEDAVIDLLREAVLRAFSGVDQEKFVLFRLCHSYRVSQQKIAAMWGWHYSKISRHLARLGDELREAIMTEVKAVDPWLDIEWEDVVELCGESVDLFDY